MSEYNPDLGTLARRVEARLVGWGWLVRSVPESRGGGYFANITTPDFQIVHEPGRSFEGGVNGVTAETAEAALTGALALAESRRGQAGEALQLRGGNLAAALWHMREGGRVRREGWPAGDYITTDGEEVTYYKFLSPGRHEERRLPNLSCEAVTARDWETLDRPRVPLPPAGPAPSSAEPHASPAAGETEYDGGLPRRIVTDDVPPMAPQVEQLVAAHHHLIRLVARRLTEIDDGGVDNSYIHELLDIAEEKFEACNFKTVVIGADGRRVLGGTQ